MAESARIYDRPYDIDQHLAAMRFPSRKVFERAAQEGEFRRRNAAPFEPPLAAPLSAWARSLAILRAQAEGDGWKPQERPLPCLVKGQVWIAATTGDECTGHIDHSDSGPGTKNRRGPRTIDAINRYNGPTLPGFESDVWDHPAFWVFLTYSDGSEVRAEVSRARSIDHDRIIRDWSERIVFGVIDLDGDARGKAAPNVSPGPSIDVPVARRSPA